MKFPLSRIIIHSFAALFLFIVTYLLYNKAVYGFSLITVYSIISCFGIINIIAELYFFIIQSAEEKSRMFKVMMVRSLKFLLYLILALVVIKTSNAHQKLYGIFIVALFFLYTAIEFSYFLKYKK